MEQSGRKHCPTIQNKVEMSMSSFPLYKRKMPLNKLVPFFRTFLSPRPPPPPTTWTLSPSPPTTTSHPGPPRARPPPPGSSTRVPTRTLTRTRCSTFATRSPPTDSYRRSSPPTRRTRPESGGKRRNIYYRKKTSLFCLIRRLTCFCTAALCKKSFFF